MAIIDLNRARSLALNFAERIQLRFIEESVAPYKKELQRLRPQDLEQFIKYDKRLVDLLNQDQLHNPLLRRLMGLPPSALLAVLQKYHPRLAKVIGTPAGMAWWERQRGSIPRV